MRLQVALPGGEYRLASSGMRFALLGEQRVGPVLFLEGVFNRGSRRCGLLDRSPVLGGRLDSPDVAGVLEREAEQEAPAIRTERQTICDSCRCLRPSRQTVQQYASSGVQRARQLYTAALGIDHQGMRLFGEDGRGRQGRKPHRNFKAHACEAPSFGWSGSGSHIAAGIQFIPNQQVCQTLGGLRAEIRVRKVTKVTTHRN